MKLGQQEPALLVGILGWAHLISPALSSAGLLNTMHVDLQNWTLAYEKSIALIAAMTNSDKILLVTGQDVPSVNFTALHMNDGSQGIENYFYASAFLESSAIAQTWNKDLVKAEFHAVGQEFRGKGYDLINGPTTNPQGRTPWGGRLVETLGQDSYLAGINFGLAVEGLRGAGIIPCGKHFLLNEQETNRSEVYWGNDAVTYPRNNTAYSSNADDKTIHETYLWPFYDGVKSGMGAVMCAMNRVNGSWGCENSPLLNVLLKTELGFPGMVVPDTSGQHTALGSANGGLDFGATNYWSNDTLLPAIANGTLSQERLDDMAIRNLMPYFHEGIDERMKLPLPGVTEFVDVRRNHRQLIRKAGGESISLLKNNGSLPLIKPRSISVFGANARPVVIGPGTTFDDFHQQSTWDGHLIYSGGSGLSSPSYVITPYDALLQQALNDGTQLMWTLNDTLTSVDYIAVTGTSGTAAAPTFEGYAAVAETCLVFINAWSGEGNDRTELSNADQDNMILKVANNCNNTIVSVTTVGARLMDAWIEHPNVTAVVYSSLLGEQSGQAIIDVLYGHLNPSGRLTYTIAKNESDYPVKICLIADCDFTEGVYLDYKYFDKHEVSPRFEFGYGLSYTSFEYRPCRGESAKHTTIPSISYVNETALSLRTPQAALAPGGQLDLWDIVMHLKLDITNTGNFDGAEVPQLYVGFPDEAEQPIRQLRGFEKIFLRKGKSGTVSFTLRRRDLSYWDVFSQNWAIAKGKYTFWVGSSSRDLRGNTTYTIS